MLLPHTEIRPWASTTPCIQSGAELLGVGLTIADALPRTPNSGVIGRSPPSRPTGWTARAGKRAEPIISAPVPQKLYEAVHAGGRNIPYAVNDEGYLAVLDPHEA